MLLHALAGTESAAQPLWERFATMHAARGRGRIIRLEFLPVDGLLAQRCGDVGAPRGTVPADTGTLRKFRTADFTITDRASGERPFARLTGFELYPRGSACTESPGKIDLRFMLAPGGAIQQLLPFPAEEILTTPCALAKDGFLLSGQGSSPYTPELITYFGFSGVVYGAAIHGTKFPVIPGDFELFPAQTALPELDGHVLASSRLGQPVAFRGAVLGSVRPGRVVEFLAADRADQSTNRISTLWFHRL